MAEQAAQRTGEQTSVDEAASAPQGFEAAGIEAPSIAPDHEAPPKPDPVKVEPPKFEAKVEAKAETKPEPKLGKLIVMAPSERSWDREEFAPHVKADAPRETGGKRRLSAMAAVVAIAAGVGEPALRTGNAVHVSFGADRITGQARQTISMIGDYFTDGELKDPAIGQTTPLTFRLGPALTATYQVQASTGNVESMFYALERIRSNYSVGDSTVAGSWRNESELGLMNSFTISPRAAIRFGIDSRFHTAPAAAAQTVQSFSTAGILAGGATLGLRFGTTSGGFVVEPFVRGQAGQLDFGGPVRRATGFSGGLTFTGRF